ncbi:MAG: STAS domain-containing protein [Maricaulis sp.]|jgi:anti-anti-sigma factor|nr:STAS domain-containing protein [Maricaulis sp.]MDG2043054.1 STAS domain-containing protein [Maricaulis sp.]
MEHAVTTKDGVITVSGKGNLTFEDHSSVTVLLDTLCSSNSVAIILDLQQVVAIDSAGIGLLLLMNHRLKAVGKTLTLCQPSATACQILDVAKIGELITMKA